MSRAEQAEGVLRERQSFKQPQHPQPLVEALRVLRAQALRVWLAMKTRCAEDKVLPLVMTALPPGNKHNSSSLTGIRAWPLMSRA